MREAERAGIVQPGEEKAQEDLIHVCKYPIGRVRKTESGPSHQQQDKWQWAQPKTQEILSECKKTLF